MRSSRSSLPWLSDHMARALAAMYPPLKKRDVFLAADKLTDNAETADITSDLLPCGADLMQVRSVIEALRVLRDTGA
jgi:hypothetical protein